MAGIRQVQNKTATQPWLAQWGNTPVLSLVGTADPLNDPVQLPAASDAMLSVVMGANIAASSPEFMVLIEDVALRAAGPTGALVATDASIVAAIPSVYTATPTTKTNKADNSTGSIGAIYVAMQFDLRPYQISANSRFYLALAAAGGITNAWLMSYKFGLLL